MNMRLYGLVLAALSIVCGASMAEPGSGRHVAPRSVVKRRPGHARILRDERVQVLDQSRRIDVNNVNMFVTNYGTFANDIENQGNAGLFFPKGTTKTAVYQSGIWLIGKENGQFTGVVTDPSGAAIPNAKVTVTNTATNLAITTSTSQSGLFVAHKSATPSRG